MKKERGITLVALVITVIILLILAGVALSLITGEEGLFARANHSAQKYKDASKTEADKVGQLINSEYMGGKGSGTAPEPDIPKPNITPTFIPETNINPSIYNDGKGVKVEITDNTNSEYQLQYSTDEGANWYDYIPGETEIYVAEYNGVVLAQLYDKATGTAGDSTTINVKNIDTLAPEEFNYTEGEKTEATITISGSAKDTVEADVSASSEVKYKYAIQSTKTEPTWESIEETTETEKTFDKVTEGGASLQAETTYYVYMLAIDKAGNTTKAGNNGTAITTDSAPVLITELAKNGTLKVGDYIDYKAGKWTTEDLEKIRSSEGNPTVTGNKALPTEQGQFGGFELEYSKDENSTPFVDYKAPETSGWRIWSIDKASGKVTIIHAGHPETYCQTSGGNSSASINILRKRNCSMYENKYAEEGSAHFLTGHEAANWYMENCLTAEEKEAGTTYKLEGYDEDIDGNEIVGENSFDYVNSFNEEGPISVLNNKSLYYFATAQSAERLYYLQPSGPGIASNSGFYSYGVRPLVILKTTVMLKTSTGNGSEGNPWKIAENYSE